MSCSHCKRTLPLSSFLANASADLGSRVFATCLHCRERSRSRRRASQPFHLHNLSSLAQLQSQHIKSLGAPCSLYSCRHPCATSPGAGFLPAKQWGYIRDFHKELDEVRMETCSWCQEHWFAMDLKDGICHSCFLRDKGNKTPFLMSAENEMDPGELPTHLPELSQVEEMVIAQSQYVQMMVYRYRGHQYHYTGHCVSFLQSNAKMVDLLPTLPSELDVVVLQPPDQVMETDPRYRR